MSHEFVSCMCVCVKIPPPCYPHPSSHTHLPYTRSPCSFGFFCGAALEYLRVRDVRPDVLHCHDWQTAPVAWGDRPAGAAAVFTIHNLNYGADLVGRAMAAAEIATTVSPTYAREVRLCVVGCVLYTLHAFMCDVCGVCSRRAGCTVIAALASCSPLIVCMYYAHGHTHMKHTHIAVLPSPCLFPHPNAPCPTVACVLYCSCYLCCPCR
jgi:hypothetical protein